MLAKPSTMKQLLSVSQQLGPLLQGARKAAGLNQTQLASRLGLSQSRVSALEQNPGSITVDQLLALCAALGLEVQVGSKGGQPPAQDWRVSEPPPSTEW